MNNHFHDALYYGKRAAEHATLGVRETIEPVETRVRERLGWERESEPEPTRLESVRERTKSVERRVESGAREAVGSVRRRVGGSRSSR